MSEATVRAPKRALTVLKEPAFHLRVQQGPDAGTTFVLEGTQAPRVLLGTSPTCDFRLTDRRVSRRHLCLELVGGAVRVTDLGSTNGTTIRGVSIREATLRGDETLEIGDTVIHVGIDAEGAKPFISDATGFGRLVGHSVAMRRLYPTFAKLAASDVPVVIEGETGVGKELLAECLHEQGPRAEKPFVVFDCAAATQGEGALRAAVAEAEGGTLVLDEIAELDAALQPLLLRAVDKGELQRADGNVDRIDVRFIATTRRDLDREAEAGRVRDDLYFRLAVARVEIPPLRQRAEDIRVLALHYWAALGGAEAGMPASALARFEAHRWPGNVRELENAVSRVVTLGEALPERASTQTPAAAPTTGGDYLDRVIGEGLPLTRAREKVVDEFERRYVEAAFEQNERNVTKAAAASGIARRYFRALRARQRSS